ncbi:MAG: YidC/Oxa1 family membrane protein insertase, partial [Minisyncoccota bacterium]
MQQGFFSTFFYQPLYNALVFLVSVVPGSNVGVSIILLTVGVRSVLLPFSHKSVVSQAKMREIAPHIEKLKEKHKDDKQEQARKMMELYREYGINPFSGLLLLIIQLPIIFALYFVFFKGLPHLNEGHLYSFVHLPETVNM